MRKYGVPETLSTLSRRYKDQAEIQRALIRQLESLLGISETLDKIFHSLLADEQFRTLLRAEDLDHVPGVVLNRATREKAMRHRRIPDAMQLLRSKNVSPQTLRDLGRMVPARREEFALLMIVSGCFTSPYVRSLTCASEKSLLVNPKHPPRTLIMKQPQRTEASKEIADLAAQLKKLSGFGSPDLIALFVWIRYTRRLLNNHHVRRYLKAQRPELRHELEKTVSSYEKAGPFLMSEPAP